MTAAAAAQAILSALDSLDEPLGQVIASFNDHELDAILMQLDRIAREYEAMDKRSHQHTCCATYTEAA